MQALVGTTQVLVRVQPAVVAANERTQNSLADEYSISREISKIFQTDGVSVWTVRRQLRETLGKLAALKDYQSKHMTHFFSTVTSDGSFQNKELSFSDSTSQDAADRVKASFDEVTDDATRYYERRFDSILEEPLLKHAEIFNSDHWPEESQPGFEDYGDASIDFLLAHYKTLLGYFDVDPQDAKKQWTELRRCVASSPGLNLLPNEKMWERLYDKHSQRHDPNHYYCILILHLILRVVAMDTSCCERTFSLMNRLCDGKRSRMGVAILRTLMVICSLGRDAGWKDPAKIPAKEIIRLWKERGCNKGASRRLTKLFHDGSFGPAPTQAEMDASLASAAQGIEVTVTDVRVE